MATKHWKRESDRSYWTPEAVRARREAKEAKHAAAVAKTAQKQKDIEYRSVPFHNDEEELAFLIKQQETDYKHGDRLRFRKQTSNAELYYFSEDSAQLGGGRTIEDLVDTFEILL